MPQQQNVYNQSIANQQPQAPSVQTPIPGQQAIYQQPQPQVIQGAGDWSGYIGPGATNLANQARIAAMSAAGNLNLALFQHPEVNDAIRDTIKMYSVYVMPAVPAGAENMKLSDIAQKYGERTAEATQLYYTINPSQRALDIVKEAYIQGTNIIGSSGIQKYLGTTADQRYAIYSEAGGNAPFQANVLTDYQKSQFSNVFAGLSPTNAISSIRGIETLSGALIGNAYERFIAGGGTPAMYTAALPTPSTPAQQPIPAQSPYNILAGIGGGLATPTTPQYASTPSSPNILSGIMDWINNPFGMRATAAESGQGIPGAPQINRITGGLDIGAPYIGQQPANAAINIPTTPAPFISNITQGPVRNEKEALTFNQLYRAAEFDVLGRAGYTPNAPRGSQGWAENMVELSSAYHNLAERTGIQQPANPFEYRGDLALSYLKGTNKGSSSSTYGENITDTSILNLPGGLGIQDVAWQRAEAGKGGNQPDILPGYEPAVRAIEAAKGQYGPYAGLYGGGLYSGIPQAPITPTASALSVTGLPVTQVPAAAQRDWISQLNYDIGGWLGLRANAAEQPAGTVSPFVQGPAIAAGTTQQQPSEQNPLINAIQSSWRSVFSLTPSTMPIAFLSDTVFGFIGGKSEINPMANVATDIGAIFKPPTITSEQYESSLAGYNTNLGMYNANKAIYESNLATYKKGGSTDVTQYNELQKQSAALTNQITSLGIEKSSLESKQAALMAQPSMFDLIGKTYSDLNKGIAPYTTDVFGIGKAIEAAPAVNLTDKIPYGQPISDVTNFGKGFVSETMQEPITLTLSYGGGKLLSLGEYGVKYGVAKAAMSEAPVIGTVGRAASTPLAADVVGLGKLIAGSYILGSGVGGIISKPTPETKGQATGSFALELAGFTAGYSTLKIPEPFNEYAGKGFFSGHAEMGPIENVIYKTRVELLARGQPTEEQATMIRVAGALGESKARFNEAPLKAEPSFEQASALGKDYGALIKSAASTKENPAITKGSMVVANQYPKETIAEAGIRQAHDWDALVYDVGAKFEEISALSQKPETRVPAGKQFESAQDVITSNIADIRPIPENYPGFKPSITPDVRPDDAIKIPLIERIIGNPFEKIVGPRGVSEVLISGKTKGYAGATNAETAQAQFGRKVGSALKDFAQDPIGQGYRGQKDLYDVITVEAAQKITARKAGEDVTKGEWQALDKEIDKLLNINIRVGSEKGQKSGGQIVNLRDWYMQKRAEVVGGKNVLEFTPYLEKSPSSQGVISPATSIIESASGGAISPYISKQPSTISSALISSASAISTEASSYLSPSRLSSISSKNIFSISPAPSKSPSLLRSPSFSAPPSNVPSSIPPISPSPSNYRLPSPPPSVPSPTISPPSLFPPGSFSIPGSPRPPSPPSGYITGYPPYIPPPSPPSTPFNTPASWFGGGAPNEGRRKGYFRFRETILGINYNRVNPRTGFGAILPGLKSGKGQGVNFGNVVAAITGKKTTGRRKKK